MNLFRLAGDLIHLLAFIILLWKIWNKKSCVGVSGKSQILFALVYITRYSDLFSNFVSAYNSIMKVVFISASLATLYFIYFKYKATYEKNCDTFRLEILLIPVVILAYVVNYDFERLEVLWTFSIYLESVAILPQLFMVFKVGKAERIVLYYVFCLGSYRTLYIMNWMYRYFSQHFQDEISVFSGIFQATVYGLFFFLYCLKDKFFGITEEKKKQGNNCPMVEIEMQYKTNRELGLEKPSDKFYLFLPGKFFPSDGSKIAPLPHGTDVEFSAVLSQRSLAKQKSAAPWLADLHGPMKCFETDSFTILEGKKEILQPPHLPKGIRLTLDPPKGIFHPPDSPEGTIQSPDSSKGTIQSPDSPEGTIQSPDSRDGTIKSPDSRDGTIKSPDSPEGTIQP